MQVMPWLMRLRYVFVCVGAGLVSVALGPDNYWDLRYYHLYAPWAYLHGRYLYDIGPAQEQGFLNPTADFLFYGLISSPLNETPRIVAFIMGAVHGLNAAFVLAICAHVLRPPRAAERWTLGAAAFAMGVSGAGFISLLGTATNDLTSSLFILGSLWGILAVAEPAKSGGAWRGFAAAGLAAGIGFGLKYTSAPFLPGLGIIALLAGAKRRSIAGVVAFGAAAALGFLAVAGHHLLTLWLDFGNPTFPYLNQVFRSPYFEPEAIRDDRFLPHNIWQLIAYPFYWTRVDTYIVAEPPFRDWRGAIAEIAMIAGVLALAARFLRRGCRRDGVWAQTRGIDILFVFVIVSYFSWALSFGYYRYVIPLEMLTGVVTMAAVIWLFEGRSARIVAAMALLAIAATTTVYLNWGRGRFGDKYVDVHVPPIPPNSIVLVATWDPVAFFIPYADPEVQYIGIENNYLELSQNNILASEVKRVMRTPGRPKFVVSVNAFNPDKLNALLQRFGLKLSGGACLPI